MSSHKKSDLNGIMVTVVTPVYNQATTLRETIESVLSQSYSNIEYIIINDGSTDNTPEILNHYEGAITIIHQDNKGQADALNRAWSEASGDFLTYLSADDILYPDCIKDLVKSIDGSAVVYYPDYDLIDASSNILRTIQVPEYDYYDLVVELNCQPGLAAIFSAEAFHKSGGWDSKYRFIPDFEFWTRLSAYGDFKRIPKVLGGFRIHNESGSVRIVSASLSDEIICFVNGFLGYSKKKSVKRAVFNSKLISSRSHFQSNRFFLGLWRYAEALINHPLDALSPKNLKFVVSGLFRKYYYQVKLCFYKICRKR